MYFNIAQPLVGKKVTRILAGRALLVKMLITLEQRYAFGSIFSSSSLFFVEYLQMYVV